MLALPKFARQAVSKVLVSIALVSLAAFLFPTDANAERHGDCVLAGKGCKDVLAPCKIDKQDGICEQRGLGDKKICKCKVPSQPRELRRGYRRSVPGTELRPLPRPPATEVPTERPSR